MSFIVFEGIDRCGKTTQSRLLTQRLVDHDFDAEWLSFPDRRTSIGQIIHDYLTNKIELDDHAVHLLFAANRWERQTYIKKRLAEGAILVCDRYWYSGVAFTAAKETMRDEIEWCKHPDEGLVEPAIVFYLKMPSIASDRNGFGEERYEKVEFLDKVTAVYEKHLFNTTKFAVEWVDASKPISEIQDKLWLMLVDRELI
jgi:dTMP kinase